DRAFLAALAGALTMGPFLSRDDQGAPLTNRDVSRLDVEHASPPGHARKLLQHRAHSEVDASSRMSKSRNSTRADSRVPRKLIAALYAPGQWTPDRLRTAGATCSCPACQQSWPTVDAWWREHNLAMQRRWPRKVPRLSQRAKTMAPHGGVRRGG